MKKKILLLLVVVSLLCGLGACARKTQTEQAQTPNRVVAANRSMADLWLLAGGRLAGATEDAMELEGIDDQTAVIGTTEKLNLEAIVALEPDLVLLSASIPAHKTAKTTLEEMQVPCMPLEIDSFDDYDSAMRELTALTGREDLYKTNVQDVRARIDDILKQAGKTEASFLAIRISPSKTVALKNDYFSCDIISGFGLENVAQDDSTLKELNLEAVVQWDPDYIFIISQGNEEKAQQLYQNVYLDQPAWNGLRAAQNNRVFLLPKDLFQFKPNARWDEAYAYIDRILRES
jgi:iron complex transport system substrate-binding protein